MELIKEVCPEKEEFEEYDEISSWIARDMKKMNGNNQDEEIEPFLNKVVSTWINRDLGKIIKFIEGNWKEG